MRRRPDPLRVCTLPHSGKANETDTGSATSILISTCRAAARAPSTHRTKSSEAPTGRDRDMRHQRWRLLCCSTLLCAVRCRTGCETWCNAYTCKKTTSCQNCVDDCHLCDVCAPYRPSPPAPDPLPPRPPTPPAVPLNSIGERAADYWTDGDQILTNAITGTPQQLIIKGVSWPGMESKPCYFHGLDTLTLGVILDFVEQNNFNAIRIPLAVSAVLEGDRPACMEDGGFYYNGARELMGMDFPTLIRHVVLEMGKRGILVMLDLHSMGPGLWPDSGVVGPEERGSIRDAWLVLAKLLCHDLKYWNVFAADLKNEPHGMHWGKGSPETRWDQVAASIGEELHASCPRWLLVAEGVGHCMDAVTGSATSLGCVDNSAAGQDPSVATWWGENLQAVKSAPIAVRDAPKKVVCNACKGLELMVTAARSLCRSQAARLST